MDSIKQSISKALATGKFEGVHVHVTATPDSRLLVSVDASASIDLPGNMDEIVAAAANVFGLGNSSATPSIS